MVEMMLLGFAWVSAAVLQEQLRSLVVLSWKNRGTGNLLRLLHLLTYRSDQ